MNVEHEIDLLKSFDEILSKLANQTVGRVEDLEEKILKDRDDIKTVYKAMHEIHRTAHAFHDASTESWAELKSKFRECLDCLLDHGKRMAKIEDELYLEKDKPFKLDHTFEEALAKLKEGKKIRRSLWTNPEWHLSKDGFGTGQDLPYSWLFPNYLDKEDLFAKDWRIID